MPTNSDSATRIAAIAKWPASRRTKSRRGSGRVRRCSYTEGVSARVENRQVALPRSDGVGVLPRHDADDLADMAEIVRDPRRQMLTQRHDAELRVPAAPRQIRAGQAQSPEPLEALGPQLIEGIEQLAQPLAARRREHRFAIERWKWHRVTA